MKVAVDAMGGDNAPEMVVQGAVEAASEWGIDVTLVGDKNVIIEKLGSRYSTDHISVHHCEEVVRMDEAPLKGVRRKKDASIRVAFGLVRRGEVDAVVSAGNSGASVAAGVLTLGRMEGVERPAIASIFPGERGNVVLIDVGANVDCRPAHLFQFGVMAHAFASSCLGMESPKIGLLSIGEEGSKGNEQVRLARELFEESQFDFVGNVEGRDIFTGDVEIIVCDGFVGNVALKMSEGMAQAITKLLRRESMSSLLGRTALLLGRRAFKSIERKLDYEEYGGAPLLGINGVGIICHGGSSNRAIKNAVKLAAQYADSGVLDKMVVQLNKYKDFMV
ncbi:MAG: phosphate acyltransferase PlsX [Deltaproteobacteria bacterium]|nr:phosphate acyltransferase PlsX [Deltaproteobacteria bacterium]MBW1736563.1 phosphate acyltransferase PlsX [Deltaproteobacteria bacterium]MBW1908043.1 phosphate acyltransferase PlsX [Deltaproteobacteria bacterium]MBW2033626.1 phosphate acyltransferase PlsX [Deltaproteobacteria bacterium]MBW2113986.1 phosphate acyltransferase PlsX [Deltaproteobacteria bacterium]